MLQLLSSLSPFRRPHFVAAGGGGATFTFSFDNVYDSNADDYLISSTGCTKRNYVWDNWGASAPAPSTGELIFKFTPGGTVTGGSISAWCYCIYYGTSYIYIDASADGSTWHTVEHYTWTTDGTKYFDHAAFPGGSLGAADIWIRATLSVPLDERNLSFANTLGAPAFAISIAHT